MASAGLAGLVGLAVPAPEDVPPPVDGAKLLTPEPGAGWVGATGLGALLAGAGAVAGVAAGVALGGVDGGGVFLGAAAFFCVDGMGAVATGLASGGLW